MDEGMNILVAGVTTVLLLWAARVDFRIRKIPRRAGFGLLAIGLFILLWNQLWVEALFYVVAIWCTSGGVWSLVLILASIMTVFLRGESSLPLVIGIVFISLFFWMRWFGGGDAQLAIGLVGIGYDWMILALLAGCTILLMGVLVFRRHGFIHGLKRIRYIFLNLGARPDVNAIRTPWAVIALIAGILYLWIWPLFGGGSPI
jgi:hypothetical protein